MFASAVLLIQVEVRHHNGLLYHRKNYFHSNIHKLLLPYNGFF